MLLRSSLVILFFFILSEGLLAGTISIQGSPQVQLELNKNLVVMSGHIEFVNLGDEKALDVFPELKIGSWQWKGDGHNLDPKQKHHWRIHKKASLSEWQCIEESCKSFQLPLTGSYPMEFYRHYHDVNGYPFSSMTVEDVFVGTEAVKLIELPLQGQLEVISHGSSFVANLSLENSSNEQLEALVTLRSTKAIAIPKNQEKILDIGPHTKKTLTFHGETRKALLNSVHDIFAIASSKVKSVLPTEKEKKREFRGWKVFSSQYHVIKPKKRVYYWLFGVLGSLIFSIFIVQVNYESSWLKD